MAYSVDFHIHSRFSRATARNGDLPNLALWAARKGLAVVGSGDFTHPAWRAELGEQLRPAEPGLFRLTPELARETQRRLPTACKADVRFMLSVEIATIYKKGDRTRKVHHVVLAPDLEAVDRMVERLERIGNLRSDGRPILGLDSRDLLEIVLDSGPGCCLIPAHIWTPWFAVLGSKSGFDRVEDCYADLSEHIFALETGLSSDPAMNWRVSGLDRYRLVSNSDAHSPAKLGREATLFDCPLSYPSLIRAMQTGDGYVGTVEFFPEEGKYHLDGHRKCGLCLEPDETRRMDGRCPECGGLLTVGVVHRVDDLADRMAADALARPPQTAGEVRSLVPLPEVLSEILGVGPQSKTVARAYEGLTSTLGPELSLLWDLPLEDVAHAASPLVAEALKRLRSGQVIRRAGYDGEYGQIRLFEPGELKEKIPAATLFELAPTERPPSCHRMSPSSSNSAADLATREGESSQTAPAGALAPDGCLDPEQVQAVEHGLGPLLVLAGPGAGKTRVLVERVLELISRGSRPESIVAITFTNRAADELRQRLERQQPAGGAEVRVSTIHGLGYSILRRWPAEAGLELDFRVADEDEQLSVVREGLGLSAARARKLLTQLSRAPAGGGDSADEELYRQLLRQRGLVDFHDLIALPVCLLESNVQVLESLQAEVEHILVDEFQDLAPVEWRLVSLLAQACSSFTAIADPDQSIYGFRGAEPGNLDGIAELLGPTCQVRLKNNYRSSSAIVQGAGQVIEAGDGVARPVVALLKQPQRIGFHVAATEHAEAEFLVQRMERMIGGHSFFSIDSGRATDGRMADLSFSDFAVLARTRDQLHTVTIALERSGLPFQIRDHTRLADLPAVSALAAALREKPGRGDLMRRLKYRGRLLTGRGEDPDQIEQALSLLAPLAARCGSELDLFMAQLALGAQMDTWDPRADRVSLLTLHAAKGLEFAVVFMIGCEDGLLPLRFGSRLASDLEEERRLFYVGMTRAARRLLLCRARKRKLRGRVRQLPPSPFLEPIEACWRQQIHSQGQGRGKSGSSQLDIFSRPDKP